MRPRATGEDEGDSTTDSELDLDDYLDDIEPEEIGRRDIGETLAFLRPLVAPHRARLALLALVLLFDSAVNLSFPLVTQHLVDDGLLKKDWGVVSFILGFLVVAAVAVAALGIACDWLSVRIGVDVVAALRERLFGHLQALPVPFFERTPAGALLSRFSGDVVAVETAVTTVVPWLVLPALEVVYSVVLMLWFSPGLSMVGLLLIPFVLLVPRVFARRAFALSYEKRTLEGRLLAAVQESVAAQPVVKAFGLRAHMRAAFRRRNVEWTGTAFRMHFSGALVEQSAYVGVCLVHAAVLGLGAYWAFHDQLSIGTLVAFEEMLVSAGYALSYVTQYVPTLAQAAGSVRHLSELLDEPPEPADPPGKPDLPRLQREIRFEGVAFRHPGGRFRLRIEALAIRPGVLTCIVGPSGSGKSTILGLLQRFREPDAGAILFDGRPVAEATRASLREQTGVVFQESFLVNASVADNIRLGRAGASDAEVEAAARAAEIHDVVAALPEGYATLAGEHGARFSGGQRQRIAIARALVRDPTLLVLDEATSALDHETEAAVNATLRRLARDCTVISITHRLGSIEPGDAVVVMDRGRVAEAGSHAELLERDGFYAAFFRRRRARPGRG